MDVCIIAFIQTSMVDDIAQSADTNRQGGIWQVDGNMTLSWSRSHSLGVGSGNETGIKSSIPGWDAFHSPHRNETARPTEVVLMISKIIF